MGFSMELEMDQLHHDKLFHGEAVAIDMAFSTVLAFVRGHISESERDRILNAMKGLRLPVFHPRFNEDLCEEALHERIKFSQGRRFLCRPPWAKPASSTTSPWRRCARRSF